MNAQPVARTITDDEYEEILDELYGEFKIGYLTFSAGRIVHELDPIAFDIGKSEEEDRLEPTEWTCENCGCAYDNEDDAEECCQTDDTDENDNEEEK